MSCGDWEDALSHFLPLRLKTKTLSRPAGEGREDPHPAACQGTCLAAPQAGCDEPGWNWRRPSAVPAQVTGVTVPGPCDLLALQAIPLCVYIQKCSQDPVSKVCSSQQTCLKLESGIGIPPRAGQGGRAGFNSS